MLYYLLRWLKPIFQIGLRRAIREDDIYAVTNGMQSDRNTEAFAKLWQLELKKKDPSLLRVISKLHGFTVLTLGLMFSLAETIGRYMNEFDYVQGNRSSS